MPWAGLQYVVVAFSGHTLLLFIGQKQVNYLHYMQKKGGSDLFQGCICVPGIGSRNLENPNLSCILYLTMSLHGLPSTRSKQPSQCLKQEITEYSLLLLLLVCFFCFCGQVDVFIQFNENICKYGFIYLLNYKTSITRLDSEFMAYY